jgi:hypothetical protein
VHGYGVALSGGGKCDTLGHCKDPTTHYRTVQVQHYRRGITPLHVGFFFFFWALTDFFLIISWDLTPLRHSIAKND